MSAHGDPTRRESPVGRHTVKTDPELQTAKATNEKPAGRDPRQEIARQTQERDSLYTIRSHKSISRLTGSPRLDSREQIYSLCDAWGGQEHE